MGLIPFFPGSGNITVADGCYSKAGAFSRPASNYGGTRNIGKRFYGLMFLGGS